MATDVMMMMMMMMMMRTPPHELHVYHDAALTARVLPTPTVFVRDGSGAGAVRRASKTVLVPWSRARRKGILISLAFPALPLKRVIAGLCDVVEALVSTRPLVQ